MQTLNALAHRALSALPRRLSVPIFSGPAKGMRWVPASSPVTAYWRGVYERAAVETVSRMLICGDTFYDIGAHCGYYTLAGARAVGPSGKVIAIDPLPSNIRHIRRHIALNALHQVAVIETALDDHVGHASFLTSDDASMARFAPNGEIMVNVTTLDTLMQQHWPVPNAIKIDVESAELAVLHGATRTLTAHHPLVFLSAHSAELRRDCMAFLTEIGYELGTFSEYPPDETWEVLAHGTVTRKSSYRSV